MVNWLKKSGKFDNERPCELMLVLLALFFFIPHFLLAQSRIKDLASVQGARDNQLIGYGLVVGLDGKGDSDPLLTRQTVANMLRRFGMTIDAPDIKAKNAAVVMLTANVSAFARNGTKIDIQVSSLADAKSLQGGTLLQTPLMGADGLIYAVAQGSVSIGGFLEGTGGATQKKNHPTNGRIPGGAIVEKEIPTALFEEGILEITLREPDFTTAVRMANAINQQIAKLAFAENNNTVRVYVPDQFQSQQRRVDFVARVENVIFRPDAPARIVINEKTGTIVANAKIRIHSVAVAHGNLTVSIARSQNVSQPNPFTGNIVGDLRAGSGGDGGSGGTAAAGVVGAAETPLIINNRVVYENQFGQQVQLDQNETPPPGFEVKMVPGTSQGGIPSSGAAGADGGNINIAPGPQTVVTESTTTNVTEELANFHVFSELPTVEQVATALNELGVTPRDMMAIFQAMKTAGALQAELILQ
ncbi:MAG: flagellar basal body P-ring protein FlgI [Verrucomicrobiota bacterium]